MMPALVLVGLPGLRRWPPLPLPLFLLWPLVPLCLGVAWLLRKSRPDQAAKLWTATMMCCHLRGLIIDVDSPNKERVWIRFV